ncbi:hypothetical protein SAMN05443665_100560 [Actinomadura meyerae]|uniref:Uncharacterized protein n=1 Tax=Actinomadura meyerae TaxID=240840 RepID=A0A239EZU5_9ACTN|nr:DUF5666 domain-containing protein [Actinomadura meyerae]SNS49563.1 hypothetical protein SAMN05443665_100560 [Actinomadura meyerae]
MSPESSGTPAASGQAPSDDAELLSSSPFGDDLDATLAARPQRRALPGPTLYLAAGIILVAGFLGGVQAQKWASDGDGPSGTGPAGGFAGGRPPGGYGGMPGAAGPGGAGPGGQGPGGQGPGGLSPGGPGGFAGGGADATTGTVVKVTGRTLYLRTASGQTVKVATSAKTRIRITEDGELKDIASGASVTVRGTKAADGTVTATTVNQGTGR